METKKTFRDLYKLLDKKTRNVIGFSDFDVFVADVVHTYKLNEVQLTTLVRLVVHIIIGLEKKENFSPKITELLKTSPETSLLIAQDITKKIIDNINYLYTKTLLLDDDELSDDDANFVSDELRNEIRTYSAKVSTKELIESLRGSVFIPDIEHTVAFLKQSPELAQKFLQSENWVNKINEIGLKYSLSSDNIRVLTSEVLLLIIGLTNKENFAENIEKELGVSLILATQLSEEVVDRILKKNEKNTDLNLSNDITDQNKIIETMYTPGEPPANLPGEVIEEDATTPLPPEPILTKTFTPHDQVKEFFAPSETSEQPMEDAKQPETPQTFTPPEEKPFTPQSPRSFIAQKLSQVSAPTGPLSTPKQYSSDPYREPIE